MNNQKILKNQLFKFIKSNLIIFIIVFVIFGTFMIFLIQKITDDSVDIELKENVHSIKKILRELDVFERKEKYKEIDELQEYTVLSSISSPKLLCIIRGENGKILNTNFNFISMESFNDLYFDDDEIDKTYIIAINGEYYYKGITIDLSQVTDTTIGYIQILSNIDSEREMVKIYERIIIWSVFFGIGISAIASVIISRRSLEPVATILKQQEEFVQNVSHEIRTPLTIIQAKQELLLSEPNAKIIDKIEDICISLNETKRMTKMTKDLMILSRGDSKKIEIKKEEVEIDEFIKNIVKTYNEMIEIQGKKIEFDLNFNQLVSIDTNKIYQVIVILLDNAIKYTEKRR